MNNVKTLLIFGCAFIFILLLNAQANDKSNLINESVSFLAIGDTPYTKDEESQLNHTVIPTIRQSDYPFVVVYGDILNGGESCTNELLTKRLDTFYEIKPNRVFYTPGDNDWTDCDRFFKEESFSELDRLEYIRKYMNINKPVLPKRWNYTQQKELPENASWTYKGIQFATVHLVGTNNGRKEILKDDKNKALDLVDKRDQANLQWLNSTFEEAKKNESKAVIIISQANITKSKYDGICTKTNRVKCNPFEKFTDYLRLKAKEFTNQKGAHKPVLFLHGDSSPYCFDKRFGKNIASNLWKLDAWGDYKPHADATVITFNPNNKNNPFESHTLISKELPKVCN